MYIKKLLDVKSLVTLSLTAVMAYLGMKGQVDLKDLYLVIISFYFGTQTQKKGDNKDE